MHPVKRHAFKLLLVTKSQHSLECFIKALVFETRIEPWVSLKRSPLDQVYHQVTLWGWLQVFRKIDEALPAIETLLDMQSQFHVYGDGVCEWLWGWGRGP